MVQAMLRTVVLIGAVALAAACSNKIDTAKAEKVLKEKLGLAKSVTVTCPSDVTIKENTKFICDVADKPPYKVAFTMVDDQGNVVWDPEPPAFNTFNALEQEQKADKELKELKFAYPRLVIVGEKPGDTVTCDATVGDKKKGKVTFTFGPPWAWKLTWN